MSERQRLINSFTSMGTHAQLPLPILTRYYLHILRNEADDSARDMIQKSLRSTAETTGNQKLEQILSEITKNPTTDIHFETASASYTIKADPHEQRSSSSPFAEKISRVHSCFQSLHLNDALSAIESLISNPQMKRQDKYYHERCIIHLIKDNHLEALSMAKKSGLPDAIFVSALSNGDFLEAKNQIPQLTNRILKQTAGSSKDCYITIFELTFQISFVIFATGTAKDAQNFSSKAYKVNYFDTQTFTFVTKLLELNKLFCNRQFGEFLAKLKEARPIFEFSIYSYPVVDQLISAITKNVVRLALFPLLTVDFTAISDELSMKKNNLITYVHQLIREGKLQGKLDLVANTYTSFIDIDPNREVTKQYFDQALIYQQNLQLNDWKNQLPKAQPKPY